MANGYNGLVHRDQGGNKLTVESGGTVEIQDGGALTGKQMVRIVKSQIFDLDNGNGATIDECILRPAVAITLVRGRIVYDDATTGTVAAGSIKVGTTVGGVDLVAATNYANTSAVGTKTDLTLVATAIAAGTPILVRHTGVAATQAGKAHVELEYTVDA